MKNFTRKLLVSIIAVAFAFVAMGTSTYAWFTMNETVSATGMQITAKTDNVYLLIGPSTLDLEGIRAQNAATSKTTAITVSDEQASVKPAYYTAAAAGEFATASKWYYEVAKEVNASEGDGTKVALGADNFANYVIKRTVKLALAVGSVDSEPLKVKFDALDEITSGDETDATYKAVTVVLVVTDENGEASYVVGSGEDDFAAIEEATLYASLTEDTLLTVDIYAFYDGTHDDVYNNNSINLTGVSFNLEFTVEKQN